MQPLRAGLFQLYRPYVWLVFAAVATVFLAACVNLATLFLARGRSREHEAAVRTALGASRAQVVRSALVEASLLCLLSSISAVLVCAVSFNGVLALVPAAFRGIAVSPFDVRLLLITLAASLVTALLAGGWPALRASRVNVTEGLRRDWRSTGGRLRGGATLLAIESAFGVFMVAGAAVTLHSFLGLVLKNPGFEATDLYEVSVNHGFSTDHRFYEPLRVQRVMEAVRAHPGVVAAGAASIMPVGRTPANDDEFWKARGLDGIRQGVGSGLFAALGTPVFAGREFTDNDVSGSALVAILNRTAAAALFPTVAPGDVVGRSVDTPDGSRTVIGVVADLRPMPGVGADAAIYVPVTAREVSFRQSAITVAVRMATGGTLDATGLTNRLNEQFSPNTARASLVTDALSPNLQQPRFQALLFGSVALIDLLLAAIGLYAVTAFEVARRRSELGIRLSLGARAGDLRQLVIRGALRPVLVGTSAGLVGAWWAAKLLQGFVFEVDARSPWTYAGVTLVLVITAVIAAWHPAQKAARTDPATVLRTL
jgi:predicted permease